MTLKSKPTSPFGGELGATTSSALKLSQIQHSNNSVTNVNINDYEDLLFNYSKYNYFIKYFEFFNEEYLTFFKKFYENFNSKLYCKKIEISNLNHLNVNNDG